MEIKRKILGVVLALAILLGVPFLPIVSAAPQCTVNTPANNANITSSPYTLNATGITENSSVAIYNVTFYYETGGTYTTIATVQNTSDNQSEFTNSWTWTSVADGHYDVNATCRTATVQGPKNVQSFASDENIRVGLDDTSPDIKVTYVDRIGHNNQQKLTITATDTGFSDLVTNCTIARKSEGKSGLLATDAGTDSFTYTYIPTISGANVFTVTCADPRGFSKTTKEMVFFVSADDDIPQGELVTAVTESQRANIKMYAIVAIVVIVGAYFAVSTKSGGKTKKKK